jgi:DeoR family fructose operon transcriptional repressor
MNDIVYFCALNIKKRTVVVAELRKEIIINSLNDSEIVHTRDLMQKCDVSEITIRRDLIELEAKGLLIRTHGGAVKIKANEHLFTYDLKINQNRQNKETICKLASNYIEDNDIIFIDCGTTLSLLTQYIKRFKNLIAITNSLPVISELIDTPNIRLSLIGGEIYSERQAIYGPVAETNIERYHANKAFIGADGVSLQHGLSSFDEKEAAITRKMIENAEKVFLLCDSSKIEKNSFVRFAALSKINYLITDKFISGESVQLYQEVGIQVIT